MSKFYNTLLFNLRAKYGRGGQLAKGSPKTRPSGHFVLGCGPGVETRGERPRRKRRCGIRGGDTGGEAQEEKEVRHFPVVFSFFLCFFFFFFFFFFPPPPPPNAAFAEGFSRSQVGTL